MSARWTHTNWYMYKNNWICITNRCFREIVIVMRRICGQQITKFPIRSVLNLKQKKIDIFGHKIIIT